MGRLIRHAGRCMTLAVCPLPVPVVQPAFRTPLVPPVGYTTLLAPRFRTASCAAIALPAVAVRTQPEHRLASLAAANPLPENHFSMNRHPRARADFDKAQTLQPDAEARYVLWLNRGTLALKERKADEAIRAFEEAVHEKPQMYQAHVNLAEAHAQTRAASDDLSMTVWRRSLRQPDHAGCPVRLDGRCPVRARHDCPWLAPPDRLPECEPAWDG